MSDEHKPPDRPAEQPTGDLPQPRDLGVQGSDFDGRRKHPSDFHADCAVGALVKAQMETDTLKQANHLRAAETYATLSLRDAVLEAAATFKEVARSEVEATGELSTTLKKATQHVVVELRKATVKPAPEGDAEAGAAA